MSIAPLRPSDALSADLDATRRTRALVEDLIARPELLGPDFAPIRALDPAAPSRGSLLGWKATGRGRPGTPVGDTLSLLEHASALGLVERLDWAFRCHAFDVAVDSELTGELHLTPEPDTFGRACPPRLAVAWLRGLRTLSVCAELHADAFADEARLVAAVEEMQGWGWQVVYADLGGAPTEAAAVRLMPRLRPAYVQLDLSRPGRIGTAAALLEPAREVGASVMALGVDTSADLEDALAAGARFGRGQLLGRPVPVPA